MLNTEIGKTGEVVVEGHTIGRLDGFTFLPDAAEAGSDAKALQAAASKALAGEIDARAEKLSNAPDDQLVLTSDGTLRWTGDAVAKLVAADDVLHPRLRIIADERLTGAPRDAVQARLDLFLKTHIEKLLAPLFELSKAEDVTGIARGIAFQLNEALGVLERQKIAAEMKDLDQPSRAVLRKYGVRFGAYHIYFPNLLKPAARSLAALLWALKQDNVDMSALSSAQHLAGSGRTSFPVDKALGRDAYRVLGYRHAGERAVRVDILERLADLIRPALSWRENSPGEKTAGAYDGRGFTVTQAMTSLTGSAGEDFASILRALGYRMEKKPALPPAPPKPLAATTPIEAVTADAAVEAATDVPVADAASTDAPESEAAAAEPVAQVEATETSEVPAAEAPVAEEAVVASSASLLPEVSPVASEPVAETPAEAATEEAAPVEAAAAEAAPAETATADAEAPAAVEAAAPAEQEMVEVWRPGGRLDERRPPRHDRNRNQHRRDNNAAQGAAPAAQAEGATNEGGRRDHRDRNGGGGRRDRDGDRGGNKDFRRPRSDAPGGGAPNREARGDRNEGGGRPPRDRDQRFQGGKGKFGGDKGREGGRDRDRSNTRPFATSASPRDRGGAMDPNSPFAKLAALKEQLGSKE